MELPISQLFIDEDRLRKVPADLSHLDSISAVGLIHPIVVQRDADGLMRLMAGACRTSWLKANGFETLYHGVTCDPQRPGFVFTEELPSDIRLEIELTENVARQNMHWQDRILAIDKIHRLKAQRLAKDGESWTQEQTGRELGVSQTNISLMQRVASSLRNEGEKSPFFECEHFTAAVRKIVELKEDELKAQMAKLSAVAAPQITVVAEPKEGEPAAPQQPPLVVPLSNWLMFGSCLTHLEQLAPGSANVCLTDPPYAIDMDMLRQENTGMKGVERVRPEHDVAENLVLLAKVLPLIYRVLADRSFAVLWCDQDNWEVLRTHAIRVGFAVQRWPLVWVKTHACLNQSAQYNFTKRTEIAMVLRKGNATMQKPQATNAWIGTYEPGEKAKYDNVFAKPALLWKWIIDAVASPGMVGLEPFAGEGSAVLQMIRSGIQPLACEISDLHYPALVNNARLLYTDLTKGNVTFT